MALKFEDGDIIISTRGGEYRGDFSVVFWYNAQEVYSWGRTAFSTLSCGITVALMPRGDGYFFAYVADGTEAGLRLSWKRLTFPSVYDTWYHLGFTASSTQYKLYRNGEKIASGVYAPITPLLYNASGYINLGNLFGHNWNYNYYGYLEDVRIYDRVLSAEEMQSIYHSAGADNIAYGLKNRWVLNEMPEGTRPQGENSIIDVSAEHFHGTPWSYMKYFNSMFLKKRGGMVI